MAFGPIAKPTKNVSTILYNSITNKEIIAGTANFNKAFSTFSFENNL